VRAWREGSPEISGAWACRGRRKGKEKGGADRWGRPVREKEGERAQAGWRRGAGLSAGGGGGPSGAGRVREREGEWATGKREPARGGEEEQAGLGRLGCFPIIWVSNPFLFLFLVLNFKPI
jgi:hypothetical protein